MKKRILSLLLAFLMVVGIFPAPVYAEEEYVSPFYMNIGKKAMFDLTYTHFPIVSDPTEITADTVFAGDITVSKEVIPEELIVKIVDCYVNETEDLYWYKIEGEEGYRLPEEFPAPAWVFQDNVSASYGSSLIILEESEESCDICGKTDCTTKHKQCIACEEYDCTKMHFYCEICEDYDCGESHLYCNICEEYDCGENHTWCGHCGSYDCGIDHEDRMKPDTAPVIPQTPTLTSGADVSIIDEDGEPVTEEGFALLAGRKSSLSAWTNLEGEVSYQWQVCYDTAKDLWVDIHGQNAQGILISPAMFLNIVEEIGTARLRCITTNGQVTKTSDAIPVSIMEQAGEGSLNLTSVSSAAMETDDGKELQKSYVVVQYVYSDGRTAAATDFAEIIPGNAYNHSYTLPEIPGYKATLNTHSYGDSVTLSDNTLTMNFAENVLTGEYTIFTVTYVPDYVSYTVIHYWQNIDNDNYTEHERETISTTHKTGDVITDAHKSYPGFYNLLYETPAAAADGSTVIEVYYDRYYYLMTFDLGDMGYGVDPIYARYGDTVEIGTPTRAGYTFLGWELNGEEAEAPTTMPAENRMYTALWEPDGAAEYTIVYWKENADDNNYSYWTQQKAYALPGTIVSGSNSVANYVTDEQYFTYNDHLTDKDVVVKGDGSTIVNVYYNRNYYTLIFYYNGECNIETHTHGTDCNTELICGADGHVHNADCGRTLTCTTQEHIHTEDCVAQCELPIHVEHTKDCLVCAKELHPAHTMDDDCYTLNCNHTHTLQCYGSPNRADIRENRLNAIDNIGNGEPQSGYVYETKRGQKGNSTYYFYFDGQWYNGGNVNRGNQYIDSGSYQSKDTTYYAYKYVANCNHEHSLDRGCYELTCDKPIHPEHTEADRCYKDVIHTQHTDNCYDHTSHSHTEDCYVYECGEEPHEHDSTCYRACTKFVHTHGNSCEYGSGSTHNYEIYRVITAKYEANIGDEWPTADDIDGFAYWTGAGSNQSSRVVTMTGNYCDANGIKLLAHYNSTKYTLNYWFEHYDQTVNADGVTYKKVGGVIYKLSEEYSQTAYYSNNQNSWSYKTITGMNGTADSAYREDGNVFNLYYTRNRVDLSFYNVNKVVKTQENLMFGQPLENFKDSDGNLLSIFVPEFPTGSYEPGSRVFAGWYTTAECLPGTEVDFREITMPNNDLILYAKWEPVSYKVNYYLTRESLNRNENIPTEMARLVEKAVEAGAAKPATDPYTTVFAEDIVKHGSYIGEPGDPKVSEGYENIHPRSGYDFIGWFYLNEDGEETAFDPKNMPVHQDLNLYAKWSSNVLCYYNVYFALDVKNNDTGAEEPDGKADVDAEGNIIYVADPISGSAIAGRTYTFAAKGGEDLYDPDGDVNYQEGYFPTVGSHSLVIDITDETGTGANRFTFLYRPKAAVPYTVKYVDKATGEKLFDDKVVNDNKNVVVTENFQYKQGYMPDAYQKTLVVTDDGNESNDVIIFYYTKDEKHALYVVNYYIQELNSNLEHAGWSKYTDLQYTGDIGTAYTADAIAIDGFTLSADYTNGYNVTEKKNGMTSASLPSVVEKLAGEKLTGTLEKEGMELNFYYTRNLYPYEFRYMLYGTTIELEEPTVGKSGYDSVVTMGAKDIQMDLDGDRIDEDYRLYEPAETTKDIHIIVDGEPLSSDAVVTKGQAKVNVATFYYVRCTQTMTITKKVADNSEESDPDPNQEFNFSLLIHAQNGYHQSSYAYEKSDGTNGTLTPEITALNTLLFTLKAGETITIKDLPTAEYTVTEINVPTGYYAAYSPTHKNKLTVDEKLDVTVTNSYDPANLIITKTVDVEEEDNNTPEVEDFTFTIGVPDGVTGSYSYTIGDITNTAAVADGKMTVTLKDGQRATFLNLTVGAYTVTETDYSPQGYDSNYKVNDAGAYTEGESAEVTLTKNTTQQVEFMNKFPVGDLTIEKTVRKEFHGTEWNGDTFTFTVERTTVGRALVKNNQYRVLLDGVEQNAAVVVDENGKLTVTVPFSETDGDKLTYANSSVKHTLTIKNLPAGVYCVTEARAEGYVQMPEGLKVSNLTIPDENVKASFENTLKRKTGSLSLEKKLVAATGFNPDKLPEGTKFSFGIELMEEPPKEAKIFVSYDDKSATENIMTDGKFTVMLEADQKVTIEGLPEGKYRITEVTIPSYANDFAHYENENWVKQDSKTTDGGQMYTEIAVKAGELSQVQCTNTYPVNRAELIIQKLVTKEYERDTLPDDSFDFTVTLAEKDADSYEYIIYDAKGEESKRDTAQVKDKEFPLALKAGQYAVIPEMPVCGYTVEEHTDTKDYNASYQVYVSDTGESASTTVNTTGVVNASGKGGTVERTFSAGKTDTVVFTNEYRQHLGQLTITKKVTGNPPSQDTFIFHIQGTGENNSHIDMDVTIEGNGSITIYDLPLGTYTVTEDTAWNWRYSTNDAAENAELTLDKRNAEVIFTNTYQLNQWLNDFVHKSNVFGKKEEH